MGVVRVHVVIGEDGMALVEDFTGHRVLWPGALSSIQRSRFPVECRGKAFDVVYHFKIDDKLDDKEIVVVFDPPNDFIVSTGVPRIMIEVARQSTSQ